MKTSHELVYEWTAVPQRVPGLHRMRYLASSPDTLSLWDSPKATAVRDALTLWTVRQHTSASNHLPLIGLRSLLRQLKRLPPDRLLEQIALRHGDEVGIIFFDPSRQIPVGIVIGKQTEAEKTRTALNFRMANASATERPMQSGTYREGPSADCLTGMRERLS